jgi:hypothetical protein
MLRKGRSRLGVPQEGAVQVYEEELVEHAIVRSLVAESIVVQCLLEAYCITRT